MARITNIALPNGTSYDIYPSEVDAVPTNGSDKMVTSDGVYDAVAGVASDLSSLNTTVLGEQSTSINSRLTLLESTTVMAAYNSADQSINLTQIGEADILDYRELCDDVETLKEAMTTEEIEEACPELAGL